MDRGAGRVIHVLDLQHTAGFLGDNRLARQNESGHGGKTEASDRAFHCFLLDAFTLYLLTATPSKRAGIRSSSEPWASLAAELVRERLDTTWGLAETGASGPTGNSYGDPAGHTCVAVVGPKGKIARTLRTGSNDRVANMRAFAAEALKLLDEQLS